MESKACPYLLAGCIAGGDPDTPFSQGWHVCVSSECRLWETKTEDAGGDPEDRCERYAAGHCNEGCMKFHKIRTLGRCSQGGNWVEAGMTKREGSPFCGSWRQPTVVDD